MRSALVIALIFVTGIVFAQNKKLDSLEKIDAFSQYIDESIELVNRNPQQQFRFLKNIKKQLWRKAKTEEERYTFLNLLCVIGYYELQQGNILASINNYEEAFAYYRKYQLASFEAADYITKPLSNNYTRLGDYERAVTLQNKTIMFLIATNANSTELAAMYGNIAISYRSMGNFKAAKNNISKGMKLARLTPETKFLLNNILADILFDEENYNDGLKTIERNIIASRLTTASNAYLQMSAFTTAGNFYLELNSARKADASYTKALSIINRYFPTSKIRERANLLTKKGDCYLLRGEYSAAINYYKKTLSTLKIIDIVGKLKPENIYGDNKIVDVFSQLARAKFTLGLKAEALSNYKLALLAGDKIRNEFADNKTKERLQAYLKSITEEALAICYELNLFNDALILIEKSKARTLLDQINNNQHTAHINIKDSLFAKKQQLERAIIYNEKQLLEGDKSGSKSTSMLQYDLSMVEKQIKLKYPQYKSDVLSVEDLLKKLPKNNIISFFVGKKSAFQITLVNGKVIGLKKFDNASKLKDAVRNFVKTYFQNGPIAMTNSPKHFYKSSYQLYKSLLANVTFNGPTIIIPDDVLGYLSFEGLITNENYSPSISSWPFLIKQAKISYAFSIATLVRNQPEVTHKKLTGLFIDYEKNDSRRLQAVKTEAEGIEGQIKSTILFNEYVNSKSFQTAFETSSVLHLSTHAYLSGRNQEPTLDLGKQKIFLFELTAKTNKPNLVFLSACKTADGILANGEGIISFTRGFSAIGTPATIAGLWNVNDAASSIITKCFYKYLLDKETAAEALRQSKLDWLNTPKDTEALYLPYYWDSLIYVGNNQVIELQTPTNWWIWALSFVLLSFALIVFYKNRNPKL